VLVSPVAERITRPTLTGEGSHKLPSPGRIGVYERGPDGLLTARIYHDVEPLCERSDARTTARH
jgi:hypothetical protein